MSTKSCPGTAIAKADVLEAVTRRTSGSPAPRGCAAGAFGDGASRERDTIDRILQLFDVQPERRRRARDRGELPEARR